MEAAPMIIMAAASMAQTGYAISQGARKFDQEKLLPPVPPLTTNTPDVQRVQGEALQARKRARGYQSTILGTLGGATPTGGSAPRETIGG